MLSVSYDDQEMTLNWHKDKPVAVAKNIEIPSYTLSGYRWYSATEDFTTGKVSNVAPNEKDEEESYLSYS